MSRLPPFRTRRVEPVLDDESLAELPASPDAPPEHVIPDHPAQTPSDSRAPHFVLSAATLPASAHPNEPVIALAPVAPAIASAPEDAPRDDTPAPVPTWSLPPRVLSPRRPDSWGQAPRDVAAVAPVVPATPSSFDPDDRNIPTLTARIEPPPAAPPAAPDPALVARLRDEVLRELAPLIDERVRQAVTRALQPPASPLS